MNHKFRLFTDGQHTYAELAGKTIGQGVVSIGFNHSEGGKVILVLGIDLENFEFLPDGYFDEMQKKIAELPDKQDRTGKEGG